VWQETEEAGTVACLVYHETEFIGPLILMALDSACELSEELQDLHIDVAVSSETRLKPHERFFTPNYYFYRTDHHSGRKGGTAVAVRKGISPLLFQ
jgi:hypothetical protein